MTKKGKRGLFIVFEGLDRSGKSTQCGRLVDYFKSRGEAAQLLRYPDRATPFGQIIDEYLTAKAQGPKLTPTTSHALFSLNRWESQSVCPPDDNGVTVTEAVARTAVAEAVARTTITEAVGVITAVLGAATAVAAVSVASVATAGSDTGSVARDNRGGENGNHGGAMHALEEGVRTREENCTNGGRNRQRIIYCRMDIQ
eukprot:GHVU01143794.1.p1 GENE.GHVU01143794.1~~GHVU01143794.1.p1  ORF type:complete len:199 (+),score=34.45 GHVU01143794.1:824-1420(+)